MAPENEDRHRLDPLSRSQELQASLSDLGHQVGDLQEDIGNFQTLMSLGTQALQMAQRAVLVEYQLTMAQEEMVRQREEYEQQLDQLRREVERRDVNFQYHQQALSEVAELRRQVASHQSPPSRGEGATKRDTVSHGRPVCTGVEL